MRVGVGVFVAEGWLVEVGVIVAVSGSVGVERSTISTAAVSSDIGEGVTEVVGAGMRESTSSGVDVIVLSEGTSVATETPCRPQADKVDNKQINPTNTTGKKKHQLCFMEL
jgi:hypothetical protein